MTRPIRTITLSTFPLVLCLLGTAPAQDRQAPEPIATLQAQLGKDWILAPEPLSGPASLTADLHSVLCRERARDSFRYRKVLLAADGEVLACATDRELLDLARAKSLSVTIGGDGVEVTTDSPTLTTGLRDAVKALIARRSTPTARPADALATALTCLEILSIDGRFLAATLEKSADGGLAIAVDWRHGGDAYGFVEHARWTFVFSRAGALLRLEKAQTGLEQPRGR